VGALALLAAGGIAYASIPDSTGVIHGCYLKKNGALRVIDSDTSAACDAKKELPLNWSSVSAGTGGVAAFSGTACVNHTYPGTISVSYDLDGVVTLTCVLANHAGLAALVAAQKPGDTNIKVSDVAGMVVGQTLTVDPGGAAPESATITSVGTTGALGTGVDLSVPLTQAHPSATVVGFADS